MHLNSMRRDKGLENVRKREIERVGTVALDCYLHMKWRPWLNERSTENDTEENTSTKHTQRRHGVVQLMGYV